MELHKGRLATLLVQRLEHTSRVDNHCGKFYFT